MKIRRREEGSTGGFHLGLLLPALRLLHSEQDDEGNDDGRQAAPEHGTPAIMRAHRVVERRGQEEARVVSGLQIAGAHLAAIFGPRFGDIRSRQRPLAADANARQQPEHRQLPHAFATSAAAPVKIA